MYSTFFYRFINQNICERVFQGRIVFALASRRLQCDKLRRLFCVGLFVFVVFSGVKVVFHRTPSLRQVMIGYDLPMQCHCFLISNDMCKESSTFSTILMNKSLTPMCQIVYSEVFDQNQNFAKVARKDSVNSLQFIVNTSELKVN